MRGDEICQSHYIIMLCVYLPSNDGESSSQQLFPVLHAVLVSSSVCTVASIIHFLFISKTQGGDTNSKVKKVVASLIVFILDRETH